VTAPVYVAQGEGRRTDVEVKPYGSSDQQYQQQRETVLKPQYASRPWDMDQLKNPLVATALGITLALLLLSLSHLPKTLSHWWSGGKEDQSMMRQYDSYDSWRNYPQHEHMDRDRSYMDRDRGYGWNVREKASDLYHNVRDTVARPFRHAERDVRREGDSLYQRARDSVMGSDYDRHDMRREGESLYQRARDTVMGGSGDSYYPSGSITEEARRAACRTAEKARDLACDYSGSSSWGGRNTMDYARDRGQDLMDKGRETYENVRGQARDAMDNARWQARDTMDSARWQTRDTQDTVANKAQSIYEQAKARAAEMLESAKQTVTYPVNVAQDAATRTQEAARDAARGARDTVVNTEERARGAAGSTIQAAKDTVVGAKEAVKDTVLGAGEAVKDTVLGAGQAVRDTVVGAGQAVKEKLTPSDSENVDANLDVHGDNIRRGPTKVKVEVQEL